MAFLDAGATLRSDISAVVNEAASADQMFIGQLVLPVWTVNERAGQWPKFRLTKGELLNDDATKRTPGASYGKVVRAYESDTFTTEDIGLEEAVDDTYKADVARYFDAEATAAKQIRTQVQLNHEIAAAAAVMNTTNFGSGASPLVDYTEANIATINLVGDITAAVTVLNNKGVIPNTIVMSKNVFARARRSTLFLNYLRGTMGNGADRLANAQDIANVFAADGITNCYVGRMPKNSAKKGATYSAASVWGDTYIWVGRVESGDPMAGGAGRTVVWSKEGGLFVAETYRSDERRSDIVRVRSHYVCKAIDGTAGALITTTYS